MEVTGANLDLATANTQEDARKAGNAFENYDLPSDVREAVEHFVETIKQVCPL